MSLALLPLIVAGLQWNLLPGFLYIGLPAAEKIEQVCIEDHPCFTPDNPVLVVVPWEGDPPSRISARIQRHGQTETVVAIVLPDFTG